MDLLLYALLFWIFAVLSTTIKSITEESTLWRTIIKIIPAILAAIFVFLNRPSIELFYLLLIVALVFCAMGDAGMEINILLGLGLFLFAHIFYSVDFILHGIGHGLNILALISLIFTLGLMMMYIFFYHRYLTKSKDPAPPEMLKAVNVYAFVISLTLASSFFLWVSSNLYLGFVPFLGAISFVISDSLIGIREFHHKFRFAEPIILTSYYLAIFLLSMAVLIY
ncbi:MAG: conserved membrane protein of unknown function [Candidatus Thorarchaeota archaeon]|nr:MAG: conserved membrane protein of unknown function [Candidatus Thorarchaeota archaeon]